jgi:hypothetical protein
VWVEAELWASGDFECSAAKRFWSKQIVFHSPAFALAKLMKQSPWAIFRHYEVPQQRNLSVSCYLESSGRPRLRLICAVISSEDIKRCLAASAANSPGLNQGFVRWASMV